MTEAPSAAATAASGSLASALQFSYQYPELCERLVRVDAGGLGREVSWMLRLLAVPGVELVLPQLFPHVAGDWGDSVMQFARDRGVLPTPGIGFQPEFGLDGTARADRFVCHGNSPHQEGGTESESRSIVCSSDGRAGRLTSMADDGKPGSSAGFPKAASSLEQGPTRPRDSETRYLQL